MVSWTNRSLPVPPDISSQRAGVLAPPATKNIIPSTAQIPPFWQYKPPRGVDFYYQATGVLAAVAGATLTLASVPPIKLTPDYEGVVASVTIFINAITTAWDAFFTLRLNGGPAQGWDRLTSFARNANSISIPYGGPLQIPPNTEIDVLVTNNAATGPWTVGVQVAGWSWATYDRIQTFGE